ncbi:MAG: aminoglycoside phosphotransferase family protein [Alphaproteobacteria bacterium]|nr:aminoglycoside phosphotransferase family protein [Alphaproteobacteria bacterium]
MANNDKVHIDVSLVRRLIAKQFPQWADLPIKPVAVGGWDNRTFHLGEQMLARMPSAEAYAMKVEKEQMWLPKLAPHLPLPIPAPLAMGEPGEGYPWRWSVYRWIKGETASNEPIADLSQFAVALAGFLSALQGIDATSGPTAGPHNFYRGGSLSTYDAETRQAILILGDKIDTELVTTIWDRALASTWTAPPVWVHGDISAGNLLVMEGKLSAVIDFGGLGIGDPACDLVIAWKFFQGKSRETFRKMLPLDAETWDRARGWALWKALIVEAGLTDTNAVEIAQSWRTLEEVLSDYKREPDLS